MTRQRRAQVLTFIVAGLAAVIGEHMLKPNLKRSFRL